MVILYWLLLLILGIALAAVLLFIGYQVLFHSITLLSPVYIPSADEQLKSVFELVTVKPHALLLDLGSGDGKVVIALAKKFPKNQVVGVEFNPFLVNQSRVAIYTAAVSNRATIYR